MSCNIEYADPADDPNYKEPTLEEKRIERLVKWLGVTDLNNTFDKMRHPKGFDETFNGFKDLAEGKSNYYMLLVYGGTGNGKTHCCEATVITLDDRGIACKRQRWSDIVRHLKELMKQEGYEKYFNNLRKQKYLMIDDIGSGSTGGSWEWGELEDIVDYRLENRLFTILTTNLDGKDIPPRIISRFKDKSRARLLYNKAPDYRPEKEISKDDTDITISGA